MHRVASSIFARAAAFCNSTQVKAAVRLGACFFLTLMLLCLAYRATLCHSLYTEPAIPPSYSKEVPAPYFWKYVRNDLQMSLAALGLFGAASGGLLLGGLFRRRAIPAALTATYFGLGIALLVAAAAILRLHYHLLFEVSSGLTAALLLQGFHQLGTGDAWKLVHGGDLLFLALPAAVFALLFFGLRRPAKTAGFCFLAVVCAVFPLQFQPKRKDVNWEIMQNPVQYLVLDLAQALRSGSLHTVPNPLVDPHNLPGAAQMGSVRLIDPAFTDADADADAAPERRPPALPAAPQGKWNVLFLVLESTGAEHVFNPACDGGSVPMPFLERMSREGLSLANHYTSGNTSPKAAYGLLTGLYCRPDPIDFAVHGRACVPIVSRFLDGYDAFMVTPMSTSFYFPLGLLSNNGLPVFDRSAIAATRPDPEPMARNEPDSVAFLLQKLDAAPAPFFAIYWSGLAHWPYPDYGAATHVAHTGNVKRDAYYDNLRVLDGQLERIFNHLRDTGKLQNTILFFVGDHGEAFGRHPGVTMHGFGSFEETCKTPAIFYQPALFRPGRISWPTSHADILPTVLDALAVRFPEEVIQGESVLRGEPRRKYVFTLDGSGDLLTAVGRDGRKVSLSLAAPGSYAYNLADDPEETAPLEARPGEIDTLVKFSNYQRELLQRYNQTLWEKRQGNEY